MNNLSKEVNIPFKRGHLKLKWLANTEEST